MRFTVLLVSLVCTMCEVLPTTPVDPIVCPSACLCLDVHLPNDSSVYKRVECSRGRFIRLPSAAEFPNATVALDMSSNDLTSIHVFDTLPELLDLDLSANEIHEIFPHAFDGVQSLRTLDLSSNSFNELPREVFDKLVNLNVLNISHNSLQSLDDDLFASLSSLRELHLSFNRLVHIQSQLLRPLRSLQILGLNQIDAYTLASNIFHRNPQLAVIYLSGNKFIKVPNEALRSANGLSSLYFNENPIRELNDESFAGLNGLRELRVDRSPVLTDVRRSTFSSLINLKLLSIASCKSLSYLDSGAFTGSHNASWFALTEVYLNDNRLTTLDAKTIPWCRLQVIDLRDNHWTCDCNLRWIQSCQNSDAFVAGVRCQSPAAVRGLDVVMIDATAFVCPLNNEREMKVFRVMIVVLGSIMLIFLTALLVVLIKRDDLMKWWRDRRRANGAIYYVKARQVPQESVDF